jgi:glutamate dehydrogenase (NAD(P)+)
MLPDVTATHVADLARAMTYKFAFLNMPFTGAKGGIIASANWYPEHKEEVLEHIGKAVSHLIRCGLYTPGPDLGVGLQDCWAILRGAGYATPDRDPDTWNDASDSPGYPTGMTVFVAADEALASINLKMAGATVAIEGFGKVGAAAAKLFSDAGAKIVAVSTTSGALYAPEGLKVDSLLEGRSRYGDAFVQNHPEGETIPVETLLTLDVDLLSPCAGQWTIGAHNRKRLNCKVISAGSTCFIELNIRQGLENDGSILVMPDFVSSSGTVLASNLLGTTDTRFLTIEHQFRAKVRSVLEQSHRLSISPVSVAQRIATQNLTAALKHQSDARRRELIYTSACRIAAARYVPSRIGNLISQFFAGQWLGAQEANIES